MKFANLKLMTIPRLKVYRKSLFARIGAFERCWCGEPNCDDLRFKNQDKKHYKNLLIEQERVNKELARRQMKEIEIKKNPAHVYTIREQNAWLGRRSNKLIIDPYYRRRAQRRKVLEREAQTAIVIATVEDNGVKKEFSWTYDDLKMAKGALKKMKKNPFFINPRIKNNQHD